MNLEFYAFLDNVRSITGVRYGSNHQVERGYFDPMRKYSRWTQEWRWKSDAHKTWWHNIEAGLSYYRVRCEIYLNDKKYNIRMMDYLWTALGLDALTKDTLDRFGRDVKYRDLFLNTLLQEGEKLYHRAKAETSGKWYADPSDAWKSFFERNIPVAVKKVKLKLEGTTL